MVYGKTAQQAGLVTLTADAPAQCASDEICAAADGVATKPIAHERCPATAPCDTGTSYTYLYVAIVLVVGAAVYKYWPLIVTKIPANLAASLPKGSGGGGIESGLGGATPPPASGSSIYG